MKFHVRKRHWFLLAVLLLNVIAWLAFAVHEGDFWGTSRVMIVSSLFVIPCLVSLGFRRYPGWGRRPKIFISLLLINILPWAFAFVDNGFSFHGANITYMVAFSFLWVPVYTFIAALVVVPTVALLD